MIKWVQSYATFLWSSETNHPLKEQLLNAESHGTKQSLTSEEALLLYQDRLVESELLYGEQVIVVDRQGAYTKVLVPSQKLASSLAGYPGWVFSKDLADFPESEAANETQSIVVSATEAIVTFLEKSKKKQLVSVGTILPLHKEQAASYQVLTPAGLAYVAKEHAQLLDKEEDTKKVIQQLIKTATSFLELPYVWAGTSAAGFDCSGFTYTLYRQFNCWLSRNADDQALEGRAVTYKEAKAGDLLYFAYEEGKGAVHHVGIYLGDDQMIHSHTPGSKVMISQLTGTNYAKELLTVRRHFD